MIGGRGRRQENTQRARSSSPRTFTVDRWAPSRREKRKYASLFKRTDWDQDGFVQGNEASELLERSGLERSSLGRAWELADQDCDGKLDFSEFVCLVHLVTCALRGQRIPGPGEGLPHQLALSLASLEPLEVLAAEREASRSRSRSASPHPSVTGTQLEHRGERRARSSSPRTFTADRWAGPLKQKVKAERLGDPARQIRRGIDPEHVFALWCCQCQLFLLERRRVAASLFKGFWKREEGPTTHTVTGS